MKLLTQVMLVVSFPVIQLAPAEIRPSEVHMSSNSGDIRRELLRKTHAQELLGNEYQRSAVRAGEKLRNMDQWIYEWTQSALKKEWKHYSKSIADTVIQESNRYGFDPVFLLAVIESESNFNPGVTGSFGEVGLMQILPETAKWIATKTKIPWLGNDSLKDPVTNIRLGTAFLAYLREKFSSHGELYLSAYNMGTGNVRRFLERNISPKEYSSRVMRKYVGYYQKLERQVNAPAPAPEGF